ncbi:hypothetical protein Tco_0923412 [Tanacetum coccineum]|uniref:Uncharacterized protein n=1 Tax=Tanacetum coccineum TaxID=301880 RepID=A0ABQ5D1Y5_9ASTR
MSLSLAENVIVAGANNCPPILDKTQYSSRASSMLLYIKGKENARRYDELIDAEKLYEAYDIKAANIVLQGLAQDIYNLYEWSKLFTDVKLAKDLHNTNFDHLYAHLRQHEAHANEVRIMKERFLNPLALVANTYNSSPSYTNQTLYHQHLSPFAPQQFSPLALHQLNDGPMDLLSHHFYLLMSQLPVSTRQLSKMEELQSRQFREDKIMGIKAVVLGVMLQLHGLTELRKLTQQVRKRLLAATTEEGHMERKCNKPKRPRNSTWFKEKALLVEALES